MGGEVREIGKGAEAGEDFFGDSPQIVKDDDIQIFCRDPQD